MFVVNSHLEIHGKHSNCNFGTRSRGRGFMHGSWPLFLISRMFGVRWFCFSLCIPLQCCLCQVSIAFPPVSARIRSCQPRILQRKRRCDRAAADSTLTSVFCTLLVFMCVPCRPRSCYTPDKQALHQPHRIRRERCLPRPAHACCS